MQKRLSRPGMDPNRLAEKSKKALIYQNARLFNGNILAAEAFKWDLEKMLHFLGVAARNPGHYDVHTDHHHTLVTAVEKLEQLRSVGPIIRKNHML